MENEVSTQVFDYTELDATTADFLRRKESNMREIVGKAYTDLGRELKEAQDALAKNGYGCFGAWLVSIGIAKRTAYEWIDRYETFVRIPHNQQGIFEDLPISLSKAVSAKSSESTSEKAQAKAEVLDGSIDTLKAYRERIAELESQAVQATEKAEQAESARQLAEQRELDAKRSAEIANRQNERLTDELATAKKPETVVVEKEVERVVEIDKTDYAVAERLQA